MPNPTPPPSPTAARTGLRIPATADRVWSVLTDGHEAWWPDLILDPVVGGVLREEWIEYDELRAAEGTVTAVEVERLLVFEWREPGWSAPLAVRFELAPDGPATTVTITESGFERLDGGDALRAEHEDGWAGHLENLAEAVSSTA